MAAPPRIVLDANVLFSAVLRDTLLRAAERGLCQIFWSQQIFDELGRSLIATGRTTSDSVSRMRATMDRAFPEAMVSGYGALIAEMENEPGDRHVAAVAVKAKAEIIVTGNLRDFKNLPSGVEALSPDEFLVRLFESEPDAMVEILEEQAACLKNPPLSFDELLAGLEKLTPRLVKAVHSFLK